MRAIVGISAVLAMLGATAANAQPIWRDLEPGMSKAQVRALYPSGRIELGEGCFASLGFDYDHGKLQAVRLEYSVADQNKQCAVVVARTMVAKYGSPPNVDGDIDFPTCPLPYGSFGRLAWQVCHDAGGDLPKKYTTAKWETGGVAISLRRQENRDDVWWASYAPAVSPSREAASKL